MPAPPHPATDPASGGRDGLAVRASRTAIGAIAAFWLLVLLAASRQPDYEHGRDFVSALASHGARWPVLGVAALLAFGTAYLATGVVLAIRVPTRVGGALMALAAGFTWLAGLARISCADGAAGCGLPQGSGSTAASLSAGGGSELASDLHGWGVAGAYVCVLLVMALLVLRALRHGPGRYVWVCGGSALLSLATVPFWLASDTPGGAQRVWLGILSAWVVLMCLTPSKPHQEGPRDDPDHVAAR